ncbi:hypothetical protein CLU79DRAFT_769743 [Phycomyces nitens]|nr:hypothetical protein CLU79DRAFT_769743 [Phycomyces nitens]
MSSLVKHSLESSEEVTTSRVLTRRASRSAHSGSPIMNPKDSLETEDPSSLSPDLTTTSSANARSQSAESMSETQPRKRRRKTKAPIYKKRETHSKAPGRDDTDRETRHTSQRMSKEAREAKRAERDAVIKERLAELDKIEKAVKDHSHPDYLRLMEDMKAKHEQKRQAIESRHNLVEMNIKNALTCQHKMAYDQFYWDKLALRRSMIQQVQQKINVLEQEYYSHGQGTLDNQHLAEWVPPERPLMISSEIVGLSEDEANSDLQLARTSSPKSSSASPDMVYASYHYSSHTASPPQPAHPEHHNSLVSPPLDIVDPYHHYNDVRYERNATREPQIKLPPLRPWQFDSSAI